MTDETFDVVTSFSVIEHIEDKQSVLDEMVRVLKPGGLLCLTFDICEPSLGMQERASPLQKTAVACPRYLPWSVPFQRVPIDTTGVGRLVLVRRDAAERVLAPELLDPRVAAASVDTSRFGQSL